MRTDLEFTMRVGRNRRYHFQYKNKNFTKYIWPFIKKTIGKNCLDTVKFLLSPLGWIIGDAEGQSRLITESDDVLPNNTQWMVWAKRDYQKSSFDNPYNYWTLRPYNDIDQFQIITCRAGECRPFLISKNSSPYFWTYLSSSSKR